jgi:hypothetical protein
MRKFGMLAALALALGAVLVPLPAAAAPADDIYSLVNQARWANGQAGLIRNAAMDQVAADWAAQLASSGTLAHNPDYAAQIPGGWTAAAENVAQGHPSGAAMHDGWMSSSGHRANILGGYTDIGIAFLSAGGTTWGVEVFASYPGHVGPAAPPPPPPAPAPAPAPVAVEATTPTPTPTATPTVTPTPTATVVTDDTGTTATVEFTRDDETPGVPPGWWAGLIAGVVVVAGAAAYVTRRRRATS